MNTLTFPSSIELKAFLFELTTTFKRENYAVNVSSDFSAGVLTDHFTVEEIKMAVETYKAEVKEFGEDL